MCRCKCTCRKQQRNLKKIQPSTRILSFEEERTLLSLLRDSSHPSWKPYYSEMADLVEVLVDTGMRLGETLSLRYQDINYTDNDITIWQSKGEPRVVEMTGLVRSIFHRRQSDDAVKPFTITMIQAEHAWRWARKEMGLQDDRRFVIHCLRRTCAVRLINSGTSLKKIKDSLGYR